MIDLGPSKYPQPNDDPNNPTRRIQWKFLMADMNGNKILDIDGNPYRHYDYSSSKTGKARKAGGNTATARLWMEALFGRPLEDDEIGPDIATQLRGKSAIVLFEAKEKESASGEPYTSISILRLSPRKAAAAPVDVATEQVQAAAANAQTIVSRARTAVAEPPVDDGLPF